MPNLSDLFSWLSGLFHKPTPARPPGPPLPPIPPVPPVPPVPPKPNPVPPSAYWVADMLIAVNAVRSAHGRPPLAIDGPLVEVAQEYADVLAEDGVLVHGNYADRIWSVHPGTAVGETLAQGYATPQDAVRGWTASAGHLAVMLGVFDIVGFGRSVDRAGVVRFVADFDQI